MKKTSPTLAKKSKKSREKISFHDRTIRWGRRFNYGGLVVATLFFCISTLPSLLPRPSLYQGLISGISIAIGYGIGTLISVLIRWLIEHEPKPKINRYSWIALGVISPVLILVFLVLGGQWQDEVHILIGEQPEGGQQIPTVLFVMLITSLLILTVSRGIRRFTRFINTQLDRILPRRLSIAIGVTTVFVLLFWVVSGLFADFFISSMNSIYSTKNDTSPSGVGQPTSPYRSGSPESLVPWDTIGYQGKAFVGRGPSQEKLSDFTGEASTEPIRAYVGLKSADTAAARAQLAVDELKRTGAFERPILILATVTGTGWLEPQAMDSLEYMYGGNSAIVAQQYSYLPSWISFLVDQQNATDAGRALYDAVYGEWSQLPKESRPKLIAYGLSLGSFGGQTPFAGVNDFRLSIDGALFVGTPNDTRLWRTITDNRDEGSPEWQPIYQSGKTVRYAATNEDIDRNTDSWAFPRMLYLQHASDSVVWFGFDLLFNEPDWLTETRGPDVSTKTHWYPFVTFLQVTVDQFFGVTVPNGHGHNYADTMVTAWAAVATPDDWTAEKSNKLQAIIAPYENE